VIVRIILLHLITNFFSAWQSMVVLNYLLLTGRADFPYLIGFFRRWWVHVHSKWRLWGACRRGV